MDHKTVVRVAPIARRLGIETFILDDGWQARSGDWRPDSPQYPEPRWDGRPGSKFAPRFPDSEFRAVREAIAPMRLGLWMSPLHFHPSSETYVRRPDWVCRPVGDALLAYNSAQPEDGSNEAGIVTWGPAAIPHVESRIREAIERWGVEYFKFDFMAWLDCAGQGDVYDMHDAFLAMVDRLRTDFPAVTFQIDETNDYRLFPFESATRGPSWFQNGAPAPERLLHNLWNLSPFVPAFSLGQHFLGGGHFKDHPVDTLMAAALPSHLTFFGDLRELPDRVIEAAAPWLAFYKRHRGLFTQLTYPLLEDPLKRTWTALQSWNPERGRGALLVFRQDSADPSRTVSLRNVPVEMSFDLFEAPSGTYVGSFTSEQLRQGIDIVLPEPRTARVLTVLRSTVVTGP
jgi:alpha-galactosidase